jgi:signal peptidase II
MSAASRTTLSKRAAAWRTQARSNPYFRRGLAGAGLVVLIDQASKHWVVHGLRLPQRGQIDLTPFFDLTYVENTGGTFGLFAGGAASRVILSVLSMGVVLGLVYWLAGLARPAAAIGAAFMMGGALGNLYDRLSYGYVVDFLDFSGLYFPWVFNLADASIDIGFAFLILDAWLTRERKAPGGGS